MSTENPSRRCALVLGGSGAVGSAVVRALASRGIETHFTYLENEQGARALTEETRARAHRVDLRDGHAFTAWLDAHVTHVSPTVLIHAAGLLGPATIGACDVAALDALSAVNLRAPLAAMRALAPVMAREGGGDAVFIGALDRTQSLPMPVAFAATQGALSSAVMALAHELGRSGIRVNLLASGLLDAGLGLRIEESLRRDYLAYSALRRFGSPSEIARAAVWLALDERSMTGKVMPVHGGI
jgi:3-oxoacyl-[acyl-carrier protein] reductase